MEELVLIIYGVPVLLGILIIRFLVKQYSTKRKANITALILVSIVVILFTGIILMDKMGRTHSSKVKICDSVTLEINSYELDHFLDWGVEFKGELVYTISNEKKNFEFQVGNGPYIELESDSNYLTISQYHPSKIELLKVPLKKGICVKARKYVMNEKFELEIK